jgi:hypothetical protein
MEEINFQKKDSQTEEILHLKSKIAFSIGALEGINFLLKNNDPLILEKNLEHVRKVVDRVVNDLRND